MAILCANIASSFLSGIKQAHRQLKFGSEKKLLMSLSDRIKNNLLGKYGVQDVQRVVKCWDSFSKGELMERYLDDNQQVFQSAQCFVEGLSAECFHKIENFAWAIQLEKSYLEILNELQAYNAKISLRSSDPTWLPPR